MTSSNSSPRANEDSLQRIACLAWGSLLWQPGVVPVIGGWKEDGPHLPIEFARVGDKAELATVLCDGAPLNRCWWSWLDAASLEAAADLLRQREEIPANRPDGVGAIARGHVEGDSLGTAGIERWMATKPEMTAVVWTSLPPRFDGMEGRVPTPTEAAAYLRDLQDPQRRHAHGYARRVPASLMTPNRTALMRVLDT